MVSFQIGDMRIGGPQDSCLVIAEIGQNHQGNMQIAKQMILEAKRAGCHCVKFQKSCLTAKFTKAALVRPYKGPHSWGESYGQHKEYLEFSILQFQELQMFANNVGILFTASAMDEVSFDELFKLQVPFIKIGSGDANNFRLIEHAAKQATPLVISTGMQEMFTVKKIVSIMEENNKKNYCLMHCISSYPTLPENTNIRLISYFKRNFPQTVIGYSGHEQGLPITLAAVLLGAKIVERHFTLDKLQKGSDHSSSLLPTDFTSLTQAIKDLECSSNPVPSKSEDILQVLKQYDRLQNLNLNTVEIALKEVRTKKILECEMSCRLKLGKSLVYTKNLLAGHAITKDDLAAKVSEPFGISAEWIDGFVCKILARDVRFDDPLSEIDFK